MINLSVGTLIAQGQVHNDPSWTLVNQEDRIEVFTRTGENSALKQIRITYTVKASMEHTMALLSEVPLYADWVYKCDPSYRLQQISPGEFSYCITLHFSFALEERKLAVHSTSSTDPITGVYYSRSVTDTSVVITRDQFIHIFEFESIWNIVPRPIGTLFIDYQALSNLGGDIPI